MQHQILKLSTNNDKDLLKRHLKKLSPSPPSSCSTQQTTSKSTPVAWRRSLRRIVSVLNLVSKDNDELQREEQRKTRDVDMYLNRPQICRLPLKTLSSLCVSFSGCGFLGSYHFGAVDCLLKNGQHIISRLDRTSGASAGSLVASLLLLAPQHSKRACKVLFELGDELSTLRFGALTPGYCLNEKLIKIVDTFLPIDISPAQGRLFISLTKQKERTNYMVSRYSSREHLIQCLLASCYIPLYSSGYAGEAPVVDGFSCFDGGYTNNLPDFDDIRTITISPFSGFAEISPLDENYFDWKMTVSNQIMNVNLQNIVRGAQALFPPSLDVIENYYELGFKDTFRFLMKNDILQREEGTAV
ncbi:hypothetical protein Q1695_011090 [Nippostrongylus brasiliensis]|nr:hypothetical protein Q1695_011090 [Nippostrongylus brasiliensis]